MVTWRHAVALHAGSERSRGRVRREQTGTAEKHAETCRQQQCTGAQQRLGCIARRWLHGGEGGRRRGGDCGLLSCVKQSLHQSNDHDSASRSGLRGHVGQVHVVEIAIICDVATRGTMPRCLDNAQARRALIPAWPPAKAPSGQRGWCRGEAVKRRRGNHNPGVLPRCCSVMLTGLCAVVLPPGRETDGVCCRAPRGSARGLWHAGAADRGRAGKAKGSGQAIICTVLMVGTALCCMYVCAVLLCKQPVGKRTSC